MRRVILLAMCLAFPTLSVLGQDCVYVPPCALINYAPVIFAGVAIGPAEPPGSKQTRFRVEEVFKGLDKDQKEVTVGASFPGPEPYLILGQKTTDGSISIPASLARSTFMKMNRAAFQILLAKAR